MSRLLRLYPAAWRERYGSELVTLLKDRPIGLGGSVDIVSGAIDAHLHPELFEGVPRPWTHHVPGLLATAAGLIWSWYLIRIFLAAPDDEWGNAIGIALILMFIALPGDYLAEYGRRIGLALVGIVTAIILSRVLPWGVGDGVLNVTAGIAAYLLLGAGVLTLAAVRAGIGPAVRWLLLAAALLAPATIAIPILGGFGPTDPGGRSAMLIAALPYGVAWTLIGIRMALRGSATIHDAPAIERASGVSAT